MAFLQIGKELKADALEQCAAAHMSIGRGVKKAQAAWWPERPKREKRCNKSRQKLQFWMAEEVLQKTEGKMQESCFAVQAVSVGLSGVSKALCRDQGNVQENHISSIRLSLSSQSSSRRSETFEAVSRRALIFQRDLQPPWCLTGNRKSLSPVRLPLLNACNAKPDHTEKKYPVPSLLVIFLGESR